jgi:membrane associated rhomboid family serine protease
MHDFDVLLRAMTTTEGTTEVRERKNAGLAPRTAVIMYPAVTFLIATNIRVALVLPIAFRADYPSNPIRLGAAWRPLTVSGEWWRLIMASFLHIQVSPLACNLVGRWILGAVSSPSI